jgi:hypothetical protein
MNAFCRISRRCVEEVRRGSAEERAELFFEVERFHFPKKGIGAPITP